MRRRSERGKGKPVPVPSEDSSEKSSTRKSNRYSRRRRKSSSSSGSESKSPKKDVENNSKPLEVQVQDIELPQEEIPVPSATTVTNKSEETEKTSNETQKEWKEDNTFWESGQQKSAQEVVTEGTGSGKDKEGSSLWKVESANGAGGGGEIQKLKICRQRPTESPELGDSSLRKRLSRGTKDGRSTDDSTHEESEKDTKQPKHRTRTSSKNSPMVSPTVVCDLSEGSPTKIKIINVSHLNADNKEESVLKTANEETVTVEIVEEQINKVKEDGQNATLDIALPADEPSVKVPIEKNTKEEVEPKIEQAIPGDSATSNTETSKTDVEKPIKISIKQPEMIVEDNTKSCSEKLPSSNSSTKKEEKPLRSSRSSSADSDSSNGESKPRKVKKKRRRELQSSVQRKRSSDSPKHESSDSEDGDKKTEAERRESTETQTVKSFDKENEADNSLQTKDISVKENNEGEEKLHRPMPRKRRWGSSFANRVNKKPILSISTDSLKCLIPDAKPVPAEELQLSVEEEEGQLDDDEEDDDVVIFVAKEEEKQLERERQKEERQKEKEKEQEEKRKKQERLEKKKSEQPSPEQTTVDSGTASRKILLLTEDAKKLARSPSPPRHRPASVLYITHLVRPFTVQQLKNLLLRTGTIVENGFWIDKIKSKCYVEYTTEDAAVETRHALHGVRWPTSNPKTLLVEFASHDDLVMAQALSEELPEVPRKAEPLNMVEGWVAEQARIKERSRRAVVREWDVGKPEHPDEVLEYDMKMKEKREQERKARKERPRRSATPDAEVPARKARRKDEDAPAKLLDDLFRKTKTSPCIYWLPLTQEQIAVKEEIRRQHMAEHERRMAELKKADLARRERERRNRK